MNKEELKEMNHYEIFSEIESHQLLALMFHNDMIDYFEFLGMKGFQRLHEYQYYDESIGRRNLHKECMEVYNELIIPQNINFENKIDVIPKNWYNVNCRLNVKSNFDKYTKKAFEDYLNWEKRTRDLYENVCCEFLRRNDLTSYDIIKKYLDDVVNELKEIYNIIQTLNIVNYDITYIREMQDDLLKIYNKKMETLRG